MGLVDGSLSFLPPPPPQVRVLNRGTVAAWLGYASMGGVATAMDLLPSLFRRFKTQGAKSYFTVAEWVEAVALSSFNLLVAAWTVNVPLAALGLWLYGAGCAAETDARLSSTGANAIREKGLVMIHGA